MKQLRSFFLSIAIVLFLSATASAQMFEGTITMEVLSPRMQKPVTIVTNIKGDKSMSVMPMGPQGNMKVYTDKASGKMTSVMGTMGMSMDMKPANEKAKKTLDSMTIEATGEKRAINGHDCELYHVTVNGKHSNWWVTGDLSKSLLQALQSIYQSGGGTMHSKGSFGEEAFDQIFKKGLMPMRIESSDGGKSSTTMTIVGYEQKHLDDSIFIIPSDVKIQSMPGMGGGQ
jgi:hypothetical protein